MYGVESDRRVRRRRSLDRGRNEEARGERAVTPELNSEEVRRRRIERLERSVNATAGRVAEAADMATDSHIMVQTSRRSSSIRRREHRRSPDERRRRRRTESVAKDDIDTYVYGPPKERKALPVLKAVTRTLGRDGDSDESSSSESDREPARRSRAVREKPKERKEEVVYVKEKRDISTVKVKERHVRESSDTLRRPQSVHRSTHHTHRKSAPEAPPASPPKRQVCRQCQSDSILTW